MLGAHDLERMRVEGDQHAVQPCLFGPFCDAPQHALMTAVHAVEGSDGADRARRVGREPGIFPAAKVVRHRVPDFRRRQDFPRPAGA